MSTQALYRKYRSSDFSQVLGQPQVVETLKSAIASGRISHAYLFTGPRGTGKTTVARLLARAVNCTGATKPCNACPVCKIDISSHLDLIEIDAASNRRIDEIRELRDRVHTAPSIGKYKVYIIDEVHMLTTEAANALLKTLEEPPSHVIFILATTEAQKLPATIISRTQRFNFKPIQTADLVAGLKAIAKQEKIKIADDALQLLAQASRGGFRDAISLLDQAAGTGDAIEAQNVRSLLGWAEQGLVDQLVLAIEQRQPAEAIKLIDQAAAAGAPPLQLVSQLLDRYRQLMLVRAGAANATGDPIFEQLSKSRAQDLARAIDTLAATTKSPWPEIALETAVVQMSLTAADEPVARPSESAATLRSPAMRGEDQVEKGNRETPDGQQSPAIAMRGEDQSAPAPVPAEAPKVLPQPTPVPSGDLWMKALSIVKQRNNSLYALLRSFDCKVEGEQLVITCRFNFHRERIVEPKNREIIEQALERTYGRQLRVVCQLQAAPAPASPGTELVSTALEILGGEVVDG